MSARKVAVRDALEQYKIPDIAEEVIDIAMEFAYCAAINGMPDLMDKGADTMESYSQSLLQ